MNRFDFLLFLALFFFLSPCSQAQYTTNNTPNSFFGDRGEVYFRFSGTSASEINRLSHIISVDKISDQNVFAYANKKEFENFLKEDIPFTILTAPGLLIPEKELQHRIPVVKSGNMIIWDFYPTYQEYVAYMVGFAASHPDICKLDTIGTSIQDRLLLAVKISDHVNQHEAEPGLFFTSSIHGDETTGYVLMLHLIDYLISNYGIDARITDMINSTEIFINPLANPDGTYYGGDQSPYGATRNNINNIDLNRNFPDPKFGLHPDGENWQKETQAFMNYPDLNHFTMSANLHGGSEVFNYPWDTWMKLTADDTWWQWVGREWADTSQKYGPTGYFTDMNNGITNGYSWYEINGGRQDYMNYWQHCREVTVEISDIKLLPVNLLETMWISNYHSFLDFIEQSHNGITGTVTDSVTGNPLCAKIFLNGHDMDSSEMFSKLPSGFYSRPVSEGIYSITFSAPGYFPKTVDQVEVHNNQAISLNVSLKQNPFSINDKEIQSLRIFPNPGNGVFEIELPANDQNTPKIMVFNALGNEVFTGESKPSSSASRYILNIFHLPSGIYILKIITGEVTLTRKLIIGHQRDAG
ncbi:MAG: M14 family zinc carboxypeptidase [Saccharofermentanaceae bacterium]